MLQFDGRTVLVESFSQGKYVTAVDLTIETTERDGKVSIAWWPDFRVIDTAAVEPDPEVAALVKGFEAELSSELDVVIGRTQSELDSRRATVRTGEAAIGNLIADAMRETTDADVALMNGGGIRADRIYPPGTDITRRDVLAELPFGNRVVKVEVNGDVLRQALEHGFSRTADAAGRFPQISGMAIEADLGAPVGSRVKSVTVAGAPLDPGKTYTPGDARLHRQGRRRLRHARRRPAHYRRARRPPARRRRHGGDPQARRDRREGRGADRHRRLNERPRHASCSGTR